MQLNTYPLLTVELRGVNVSITGYVIALYIRLSIEDYKYDSMSTPGV